MGGLPAGREEDTTEASQDGPLEEIWQPRDVRS